MKILVGILVTIENEYDDCVNSIKAQSAVEYHIFEVRNKTKNQAHDLLYSHFQANTHKHSLLIKIDADMVISDNHLFERIVKEFEENEKLDRLFIPTFDHFVGKNLGGVNVYRNTVKWGKNKDNFYTDRVHDKESIRESKKWNPSDTEPLIHHCPNPSDYQAFHFGLHRMMKAIQPGKFKAKISKVHWASIKTILERFKTQHTNNLKYALMGADCALSHKLTDNNLSYGDKKTEGLFEKYQSAFKDKDEPESFASYLCNAFRLNYPYDYWRTFLKYRVKAIL